MKTLIALLLISSFTQAGELEFRKTDVNMTWGNKGDFDLTLYQLGFSEYVGDYGFRVMVGQSGTEQNRGEWKGVTAKLQDMWTINVHRRFIVSSGVTIQVGYNILSEYKEKVDGQPKPDSGTGLGVAIQQRFNKDFSVKLSYDNYYEKPFHGGGKERTHGVGISLVYGY